MSALLTGWVAEEGRRLVKLLDEQSRRDAIAPGDLLDVVAIQGLLRASRADAKA